MITSAKGATLISAFRLPATMSNNCGPLACNILSYKINGTTEYIQNGRSVLTSPGKLVFMPAGSQFRTNVIDPGDFIEVKFTSLYSDPQDVLLFSGFSVSEMEDAFSALALAYSYRDDAAYFKGQILLNRIFLLMAQSNSIYISKQSYQILSPAIEYMKEHIREPSFSVSDLVALSGVSDTYFRKLFTSFYHATPQHYIICERINYAKQLLLHEPSIPIQQLSEYVGYNDAFYFSRIFKKLTGESPSSFAKRANSISDNEI